MDICTIFANDGNNLKPLNISLRKKQKGITSFLLTKQWTSVNYGATNSKQTLPLSMFSKLKKWGERAREKALFKYGANKSSMKVNQVFCQDLGNLFSNYNCHGSRTNRSPDRTPKFPVH